MITAVDEIEYSVKSFLREIDGCKIIVGLSGGADSVGLLAVLMSCGAHCIAAHCNFGLRGKESDRDMNHAIAVADRLGVRYETVHFDVRAYMESHKCSLETACRELRYSWFENIRKAHSAHWIAVAHHRDDNNETLLLNLFRGTGVSGLRGMRPINGKIIRPLLKFTRKEIESYVAAKKLDFVTDSSNLVSDVSRNKIRNIIMPFIRESFPNADHTINLTADNLYSADSFISEMIDKEKALWTDDNGNINVIKMMQKRESAMFILYELLKPKGINAEQVREIAAASQAGVSGRRFCGKDGNCWLLNRGVLEPLDAADNYDTEIITEIVSISEFTPGKDPYIEFFDLSVLEGEPLCLRHWQQGDRIKPFGMKGSRLVSDIMNDAKIGIAQKKRTWILAKGAEILWVEGLRRGSAYPVHPKSAEIVRVHIEPARNSK